MSWRERRARIARDQREDEEKERRRTEEEETQLVCCDAATGRRIGVFRRVPVVALEKALKLD